MQLTLTKHQAKLANYNPHVEKHGEDSVPAASLKIEITGHSSLLDAFDPSYRAFLFRKPDLVGEQQPLLKGDELTALAKPNLKPLRLDEEFPGYTLRISIGLEASEDIVLADAKLSNFVLEAINGGSVTITLTASTHPDEDQAGQLYTLQQQDIELTLEPPRVEGEKQQRLAA
jgi:hypothetical protein